MADVTVMGAGVFGLSVAFACARRGARVAVIERTGIAAGCSGGVVGMLAPHAPEKWNALKAFQLDSLLAARDLWTTAAELSGIDPGHARVGRLQPIRDARGLELARARAAAARELWPDHVTWEVIEAPAGAWTPASPTGLLIRDTLSARVNPRAACQALAGAIRASGGTITAGDTPPDGARPVVWATGVAGLRDLSAATDRAAGNGVKGQAALLGLNAAGQPQIAADGVLIVPHADGTVAVGSTSERDYTAPDTTDQQLDALLLRAGQVLPVLAAAPVIERWAGLRPRAKSRAPMLGPWPGRPGHYIANGGFKIGFGMAPVAGEVMADLLLDGIDRIPESFHPEASL
ncbi:NAD(P)/FAD-dependent oxidoreductase [Roseovarius salinarum]|uniref:NAD(P)/FAD-dependent oxidoreductase n=1 Tax=Roseovarius salinarum TaxID=1981892 RepID=UPI000C333C3D|nr:FAD-dependent oxidoreductase [Roseovarius salinarum]